MITLDQIPEGLIVKQWKATEKDVYLFCASLPEIFQTTAMRPPAEIWQMIKLGIYTYYGIPIKAIE